MQYDSDRLNTLSNAEYWMNSAVRNRRYISPALSYFEKCIVKRSVFEFRMFDYRLYFNYIPDERKFFYKYLSNGWKYNVFCFHSVDVNYSRFYTNLMTV